MKKILMALILGAFVASLQAELIDRGGGLIYDSDQNLTWLQNPNFAETNGDDRIQTFSQANTWAAELVFGGYSDWRLPTTLNPDATCSQEQPAAGLGCTGSEMGYLNNVYGISTSNPGPFESFISPGEFWSDTEDSVLRNFAFSYNFGLEVQRDISISNERRPWAVRDGDVDPQPVFSDVQADHWAFAFIGTLATSGITTGCGNGNYCPDSPVSRAQMAVFLERGIHGSGFSPPAASGNAFLDVSAGSFAASFIEQFALDGITSGCGNNNYCPDAEVTRDQMAVFLLRAEHGAGYSPPPAIGVFNDVPLNHWAAHWIEQLSAEGITAGCGNGNYCPDAVVTRDQMAVFLVRTFGL